jgi:CRISPR-associated protein Csb3
MKYDIQVNPMNPVEYLACCGLFEILARFDNNATSWWEIEPQPRFWIESEIDEASLLACLTQSLTDGSQWQQKGTPIDETPNTQDEGDDEESDEESDETGAEESEGGKGNDSILISTRFSLNDKNITLVLDWWYETLTPKKKGKSSSWKLYTGQQTIAKIIRELIVEARKELQTNSCTSFTNLIKRNVRKTGRFRFDPRSFGDPLDTGYSANDLKKFKDPAYKPVKNFLFAELLAIFAVQYLFPHRTKQSGGTESARGWMKQNKRVAFRYGLWMKPLPISLVRIAAIGAGVNIDDVIPVMSERKSLGSGSFEYRNLMMAKVTTW